MELILAANRHDIVNMLRSKKHRSRKHRVFAMPNTGFDGESVRSPTEEAMQRENIDAAEKLLEDFAW